MTDATPTTPEPSRHAARAPRRRRRMIAIVAGSLVAAAAVGTGVVLSTGGGEVVAAAVAPAAADGYKAPASSTTAKLPAAVYDAVIPGLLNGTTPKLPLGATGATLDRTFTLEQDAPLYGEGRKTAVARLQATDFLGEPTPILRVGTWKQWSLVLTPARVQLPSKANGNAAAQSAGWIRSSLLTKGHTLDARVVVSVAKQTLTITRGGQTVSYKVGVGTPDAPTPTGVTGYLQARYLDPKQGQSTYPIQLTSLHSAAQDEPYKGSDGGLIGAHYADTASGAVSHGCIRLTHAAVAAVNQLPRGTPISITD
jgi:lipoprotein-anchoring transpeptidase ErfK/SrfK